jgi:hypothetical protein
MLARPARRIYGKLQRLSHSCGQFGRHDTSIDGIAGKGVANARHFSLIPNPPSFCMRV